jgi:hypothetical protein
VLPSIFFLLKNGYPKGANQEMPRRHGVWVYSRRLPMMHRYGWTGRRTASNVCFAWFIFDTGASLKCQLGWVDWKALEHTPERAAPALTPAPRFRRGN